MNEQVGNEVENQSVESVQQEMANALGTQAAEGLYLQLGVLDSLVQEDSTIDLEAHGITIQTVIATKAKLEDPNYELEAARIDIKDLYLKIDSSLIPVDKRAEFEAEKIKSLQLLASTTPEQWEISRKAVLESNKMGEAITNKIDEGKEVLVDRGLTYAQQRILGDPDIKLKNLSVGSEVTEDAFLQSVAEELLPRFRKIAHAKQAKIRARNQAERARDEMLAEAQSSEAGGDGASSFDKANLFKIGMKASSSKSTLKNFIGMASDKGKLSADPMIALLFEGNEYTEFTNAFEAEVEGGGPDDGWLLSQLKTGLKNNVFNKENHGEIMKELSRIQLENQQFNTFAKLEQGAAAGTLGAKERAEKIATLLDDMPEAYHKSQWGKAYESYVEKNPELALKFEEWLDTTNINPLVRMFYDYIKPLINLFGSLMEDPKDAEKKLQSTKYRELAEKDFTLNNEDSESINELTDTADNGDWGVIIDALDKKGIKEDDIKLTYDGVTLEKGKFPTAYLETIQKFAKIDGAEQLFTTGLAIEDIQFLLDHHNGEAGDGIVVYFHGKDFDIDIEAGYLENHIGDELVGMLGVAGGAAAAMAWNPFGWIVGTGVALGTGYLAYRSAHHVNTDWGIDGEGEFSYDAVTPEALSKTIKQAKEAIAEDKERIETAADALGKLSEEDQRALAEVLPKLKNSKAFEGLYNNIRGNEDLWDGYNPSVNDLQNFVKAEESNIFDSGSGAFETDNDDWYQWFGKVIGENGEVDNSIEPDSSTNYLEVDGTGWVKDQKFKNARSFFAWLAKQDLS